MKFFLLLVLATLLSLPSTSQEISKTEGVYHKMEGENSCRHIAYLIAVGITYDKSINSQNYTFEFSAQDSNFDCLSNLFVLKNGTAQDIYDLLVKIENFGKQIKENGVSINYTDYKFIRWNFGIYGKRIAVYSNVYSKDNYHSFKEKDIATLKKKLISYCKEKGIKLDLTDN